MHTCYVYNIFFNTYLYLFTQNRDHKHRTEVFVMTVTEELQEWEDSRSIGRNRQWFTIDDALNQLALHKPTQRSYLQELRHSKDPSVAEPNSTTSSTPTFITVSTTPTSTDKTPPTAQ